MYLSAFGLSSRPFLITPDPQFLYHSDGHQAALAHLQYGLQREGGFLLLTGEVGTGKTTLCRYLIEQLPDAFRLAYVLNARLNNEDLLSGICRELSIPVSASDGVRSLVEKIYDNLLQALSEGRKTLIVIEEAQNLSPDVLETLRLLTNLETSQEKLLHILLVGQPELLLTLKRADLRQLQQRVVSRSHLCALSADEVRSYVVHRLQCAGSQNNLFSDAAMKTLYQATHGYPRLINLLAEHCLLGAYALGRKNVSAAIVRQAQRELGADGSVAIRRSTAGIWQSGFIVASILCLLAVGFISLPPITDTVREGIAELVNSGYRQERVNSEVAADEVDTESVFVSSPVVAEEPANFQSRKIPADHQIQYRGPSAYEQVLAALGVHRPVSSYEHMCVVADEHGYQCIDIAADEVVEALRENSPVLLSLGLTPDTVGHFFVKSVDGNQVQLSDSSGVTTLAMSSVAAGLRDDVVLLWEPPAGFRKPLHEGQHNRALVDYVQRLLVLSGHLSQSVVTGGVYTRFLSRAVKEFQSAHGLVADGIIGRRTLQKMRGYSADVASVEQG